MSKAENIEVMNRNNSSSLNTREESSLRFCVKVILVVPFLLLQLPLLVYLETGQFQFQGVESGENAPLEEWDLLTVQNEDAILDSEPPGVVCTTSPLCMFRTRTKCDGTDSIQSFVWFSDSDRGGPEASTLEDCEKRRKSWEDFCSSDDESIDMFFDSCKNKEFDKAKEFEQIDETEAVKNAYITLWLHQIHSWFRSDENEDTASKVRRFMLDSKKAGFTEVMVDLPWAWTEREDKGQVNIDSFSKEDAMVAACESGLRLHVVLSMREFPPWLSKIARNDTDMYELGSSAENCPPKARVTNGPSNSHPEIWEHIKSYVDSTSRLLIAKYGDCIASISPTMNNEFETRYTQTFAVMRDYSPFSVQNYKEWQIEKGLSSREETVEPPQYTCSPACQPILDDGTAQWLGYREEFLAQKYGELCKIVKLNEGKASNGRLHRPDCLLHIGEIFSTTDSLNSNLFFKLAKSEYVDHLVMDSNMALFGAPTSPSIVGILVSTAQAYGKSIHYEAATERILKCTDAGEFEEYETKLDERKGVNLLFRSGIARALESGVNHIGVTNLCKPLEATILFPQSSGNELSDANSGGLLLKRASTFKPTAVIFVPYRAFYAFNFVISGRTCGTKYKPCWHDSFTEIPRFGNGKTDKPHTCNVDVLQDALIQVWDDLRTRNAHVAVVADPDQLTDDLLQSTPERVFFRLPCVMTDSTWNFFEGERWFDLFREKNKTYPFSKVDAELGIDLAC